MPDRLRQPQPSSPSRSLRSLRAPSLRLARAAAPNTHVSLVFASPDHLSPSVSRSAGASTSEDLLSRQLDRDAGGQKMGLRSRRSSSATVRSVRTDAGGAGAAAPSPTVVEEDETAHASSSKTSSEQRPDAHAEPREQHKPRNLNPKTSATWLRWNAPPPSFPRAGSKKGKEVDPAEHGGADVAPPSADVAASAPFAPLAPSPTEETAPTVPLSSVESAVIPLHAAAPKALSRGWRGYIWGVADSASQPATTPPEADPQPAPAVSSINSVASAPSSAASNDTSAPQDVPTLPPPEPSLEPAEQSPVQVAAPAPPAPSAKPGWGAYLASYVVTPKPAAVAPPPAPEQPPVPVDAPEHPAVKTPPAPVSTVPGQPALDVVVDPAPPAPVSDPPTQPLAAPTIASIGTPTPSGSTGWLNYLALRSQKRIAPASLQSIEARKSGETVREEVMDFEHDPEFPAPPPDGAIKDVQMDASKGDGKADSRVKVEDPKRDKAKPTPSLAIKKKRLSVSSATGASSPLSSSPRAPSIDSQQSISASRQPSSLPPPPQARQPNLVIPSFATTFDRPPRSFPPARPPAERKGVAAATGHLAWRALGAVGSYVYGVDRGDGKETRGTREGRYVGADLPRRTGLSTGTPEEGWRQVRRVVVVGVHGWFPAKMLNSVIGEPTGTSIKFATMMGDAVRAFFRDKDVEEADLRLTLIPLEGEGTIDHRVDKLYKAYLSNPAWINDLRRADAIFFAAHSQGCIVTTHLISRLIAQGHIRTAHNADAVSRCEWAFGPVGVVPDDPRRKRGQSAAPLYHEGGRQKVAMLAMCGVHLGPLYSISTSSVIQPYLQWFENAAARELFEFQDTASAVSGAYQRALAMVLDNAVRVLLVASVNDQVVPIYGASFSAAAHPLLLRALFVDAASYPQADFMTNLLCFAFMLRNAGIDDQGLVEHLSEATAGSLTGVGHSTPYDEPGCYALAVDYLLRAGPSPTDPLPPLRVEPFAARNAKNDYELPWIMRALVDAPEVKDLFPGELRDLREGILHWKPQTKALKEIKKRLEPMAGRQSRLKATASSTSINEIAPTGLRKDW
ncbi:hypothetical protein Q5752_000968 [Cryptotrichosporon argae]